MKKVIYLCLMMVVVSPWVLATKAPQKRIYSARHINPHPPKLDGKLNDEVWKKGDWAKGFIQRIPHEGKKPSHDTAFKILFDEKNLYITVQAFDDQPGKIVKRLSRRDHIDGDSISINIDSYFDQRTAFCFTVAASGAKGDVLISDNGRNEDANWDPVWEAKTSVNDQGWVAEIKIPFSQLRFGKQPEQTWGLHVSRNIFRLKEESGWQHIPRNAPGFVNYFGLLKGLEGIKQGRRIELMPYAVGKTQRYESESGNPFATGKSSNMMAGLDGKIGLTSDLTLDFTVNPDFGQIEADPSQVNLTAFETYFDEKRPFFIEGNNILNYRIMWGNGDFGRDNLFYSRRIGRRPQYDPETDDDHYVDMPENTSILTAVKITGKTRKGLSIGIIDSLTKAESATIGNFDQQTNEKVEPFTNYFGLRLQQDFNRGKTTVGAMLTAVNRDINDNQLNFLHKSAYTGGVDFSHSWKNRSYQVILKGLFSRVAGDKEAILNTQESPSRYFQRPDAEHVSVDPLRTSLSGHGGDLMIGKVGGGNLRFVTGVTWRSPGLELNDMGYLYQADIIMQWMWAGYQINKPFALFRRLNFNANQWQGWEFSGTQIFQGGNFGINGEFKNFWTFGINTSIQGKSLHRSMLRGGPAVLTPGGSGLWLNLGTDRRKKLQFNISGGTSSRTGYYRSTSIAAGFTFRPSSSLSISATPMIRKADKELQFVDSFEYKQDTQYLLGAIDQTTYALTLRLNFSITPELSIQFYGQPFVSTATYSNFKTITNPRAADFKQTFNPYLENQVSFSGPDNLYTIDQDSDGFSDYEFENPNFNFLQFRCNLVVRWEYQAGSAVYLVWTQSRTNFMEEIGFSMGDNFNNLFDTHPHNVFLIKFAHRLKF